MPNRRLALRLLSTLPLSLTAAPFSVLAATESASPALATSPDAPLKVVATFSILGDLVAEVGGHRVQVSSLVGPNADAHAFEPRPAAARALAGADLVVCNGLHFEGWLDRLVRASGYRGPIVTASRGVAALTLDGHADPHAWQNLQHGRRYVQNISEALVALRPAWSDEIQTRTLRYDQTLQALDAQVRQQLEAIPVAQRTVVTSHDAFGYFAQAYGVRFHAAQGWTTEREASAAQVARLIQQLKRQQVRAVFVENMSNPKLMERVAREANATLGGTLYADALSAPGEGADTYVRLFEHNVGQMLRAWHATVPPTAQTAASEPPANTLSPR